MVNVLRERAWTTLGWRLPMYMPTTFSKKQGEWTTEAFCEGPVMGVKLNSWMQQKYHFQSRSGPILPGVCQVLGADPQSWLLTSLDLSLFVFSFSPRPPKCLFCQVQVITVLCSQYCGQACHETCSKFSILRHLKFHSFIAILPLSHESSGAVLTHP